MRFDGSASGKGDVAAGAGDQAQAKDAGNSYFNKFPGLAKWASAVKC